MLVGLGLQSLRKGFQIRKKENNKIKADKEHELVELTLREAKEKTQSQSQNDRDHEAMKHEDKEVVLEVIDFNSVVK